MLLSTTDEDVLSAAEALGDELAAMQSDVDDFEFETVLRQCNEAISEGTGIQYGDACDAGGDC